MKTFLLVACTIISTSLFAQTRNIYGLLKKSDGAIISDNTLNAWCMPGGKVVVYTGLLPYTLNENALAVVMGHEIAHAIARHGNERMSQGLLINLGGLVLQEALKEKKQETQALFLGLYMVGSNLASYVP